MPIYEYRCEACGRTLEALQKLSDEPLKECSACGAEALRRLISAPAFRLKGSGWYETDFKSDKEKKRNLADGAGGAPAGDTGGKAKDDKAQGDKASPKDASPAKGAPDSPKTPAASKPSPSPEAA